MRLDRLWIHEYKNLRDITIDFDEDQWVTVLIGWNGAGKSNVIEALAIIFRDLIQANKQPTFSYKIHYRCNGTQVYIHAQHDKTGKDAYTIRTLVSGESLLDQNADIAAVGTPIPFSRLTDESSPLLPRYVFGYYSGHSDRLADIFRDYTVKHDKKLRGGDDPGMKRLFYALPVHSNFVLLSFILQQEDLVRSFLTKELGLDPETGIESILFVIREPPWARGPNPTKDGFWNAKGRVRDFLDRLYANSLAPIQLKRQTEVSLWSKQRLEYVYLYLKDLDALRNLVGNRNPRDFFSELESTYVSELIEEVRIRVRLKKNDGSVTFRELSEGEQQLLTVLGLLRFTAEKESLFLLDEPDTHLNPRWAVDYLRYLKDFIASEGDTEQNSHILITTHNPLAIAELTKRQVRILKRDQNDLKVSSVEPHEDPKGMGYAGIITSDMFGISSSLDKSTQQLLEKQRAFGSFDKLSTDQLVELDSINRQLDRLGFRFLHPDDEYSRYLRIRNDALARQAKVEGPDAIAGVAENMTRDEREALAEKLITEIIEEDRADGVVP